MPPGRSHFGNLILSRLPVLQVFRHLLPWRADPAVSSMQRICVEAVVDAPSGPMRVMTSHLEYYSDRQRKAQVEAIREIYRDGYMHALHPRSDKEADSTFAVLPRGLAALFCGDLNFRPDAPEHAHLVDPFDDGATRLRDAWGISHPGRPHAPTVGVHDAECPDDTYCCDSIFVSEDLAHRVIEVSVDQATDASDHQPLRIELTD